jgi:hypothetical protein
MAENKAVIASCLAMTAFSYQKAKTMRAQHNFFSGTDTFFSGSRQIV